MALSVDQKRLKATKFPPEFDKRVDIKRVNIDIIKKWVAGKITTILGDEDDVIVETIYNLLEQDQFVRQHSNTSISPLLTECCSPKSRRYRFSLQASLTRSVHHSVKSYGTY